jgi:hypothetical protein
MSAHESRYCGLFHASLVGVMVAGMLALTATPAFAAAPAVTAESFSHASSASVTLHAQINPEGLATSYRFQYGTSESYGSSTPLENAGAGSEAVSAIAQVTGLQPETTYHFRLVASSEGGETRGEDRVFTTLSAGLLGLPDGRGYELVSTLVNPDGSPYDGNVYEPIGPGNAGEGNSETASLPFQAAVDGDAVAYVADPPAFGGNGNQGDPNSVGAKLAGNEWMATRAPSGGWTATDIEPAGVEHAKFQAFSSDLSVAFLDAAAPVGLAPGAPGGEYNVLYTRNSSDGAYHPFFTMSPQQRSPIVQGGTPNEFRTADEFDNYTNADELDYAGASSNLSHLLFEANDTLTENAPEVGAEEDDLYDSVDGSLYLVNVLPGGEPATGGASFGSPSPGALVSRVIGPSPDFSGVISSDGSRVFWSTVEAFETEAAPRYRPKALYVRENDTQPENCTLPSDACTLQVDASQDGGPESGGGMFWTASADGSKVFFTDCRRLTAQSTAIPAENCGTAASEAEPPNGNDLYEYELNPTAGKPGVLRDLTVDEQENADVQAVIGASEDGEDVYFVADGVLTGANLETKEPLAGQPNLYLRHDGVTTFIATLAPRDNHIAVTANGLEGDWQTALEGRTAEVTPNGQSVVFMSTRSLTGYDNNAYTGRENTYEPLAEVYVYNAATGRIVCASCNPSGEPPTLPSVDFRRGVPPVAGYLPVSFSDTEAHRWISQDGTRVFFESSQALVPQGVSGQMEVYEWEQDGTGSCARSEGCVYLLSGGTSSSSSYLLDASASGDDVFISTSAQLVPEDKSENYHVYDVRVGATQPPATPGCSGAGCQGVPSTPPSFATPATVTADSLGNFSIPTVVKSKPPESKHAKCKHGFAKNKKGKCVKKPKKKKTKVNRRSHGGRASR